MANPTDDLDQDNPIFVIGAKRGGTTLMRRVMDAHPDITIPPPGWLFHYIYPYLYSYGDLSVDENFLDLVSDSLAIPMIREHWGIDLDAGAVAERCVERSFRGVMHALTAVYVENTAGGNVWGSKAPGEAFWIREIHQEFPGARFVFLVRDGRDVATDLSQTIWGPRSAHSSALNWRRHMEAILGARRELPSHSHFTLRYEEFVRSPEEVLRDLCTFLDLPFSVAMVNHHEASTDQFVTSSYHAKTNSPITDKYVGIYKRLPIDDQQAISAAAGDLLTELGYDSVPVSAREVSRWELLRNADLDDHGGMMLRGGVEFMEELRKQRGSAFDRGRWTAEDRLAFLDRTA